MKKYLPTIIVAVIFLCGLSLFLYPTVSNLYNDYLNKKLIGDYENDIVEFSHEEYAEEKQRARDYNTYRYDEAKLKELDLTYESVLNIAQNGIMGYVEIPKISVSLVIYHTIEEDVLQNGIGHMKESSLPIGGLSTHCVLAGHTGLPSAKLLTNIDHLKIGDMFYIHVLDEVLSYQIDNISVVEPDEVSLINVVTGKDYVTLVTCTPYGVNTHRLLVRGIRADGQAQIVGGIVHVPEDVTPVEMRYLLTFSLIGSFVLVVLVYFSVKLRKKRNTFHGGENTHEKNQ